MCQRHKRWKVLKLKGYAIRKGLEKDGVVNGKQFPLGTRLTQNTHTDTQKT